MGELSFSADLKSLMLSVVVFKISENLVEFKPFETLDKRLFFRKNQLRACLIYTVHNVCKLFDA